MLRARDAMDRSVRAAARHRRRSRGSPTSPRRTSSARSGRRSARRRTATCSAAASSARCSCCAQTDRSVTEICLDVGFTSLGTFSRTFRDDRRRVADRRTARAAAPHDVPDLLRDGVDATEQFRRSQRPADATSVDAMLNSITHLIDLRPRPGRGARLLRRQARPGGQHRRRPRLHALAHRQRPRRARPRDPARAARARRRWTRRPPSRSASWSPRARPAVALGFRTDDCRKTYEELKAKGVEFTEEPTERSYGIDCGLRDPFGNHIRIVQPAPGPARSPDPAEFAQS